LRWSSTIGSHVEQRKPSFSGSSEHHGNPDFDAKPAGLRKSDWSLTDTGAQN
jgi:hypothetical protein